MLENSDNGTLTCSCTCIIFGLYEKYGFKNLQGVSLVTDYRSMSSVEVGSKSVVIVKFHSKLDL